jgi:lipopolysaccharide export system protein LptA
VRERTYRMGVFPRIWAVSLLLVGVTLNAAASDAPARVPLSITADRLEVNDREHTARFSGRVQVDEGTIRLGTDQLVVYYDNKTTPDKSSRQSKPQRGAEVREIRADGNVTLQQAGTRGEGDRATYRMADRTMVLFGDRRSAWVQQGEDRLEGGQITVLLTPERRVGKVTVSSPASSGASSGRVSARIVPRGSGTAQGGLSVSGTGTGAP